jgi:hypothetical protein
VKVLGALQLRRFFALALVGVTLFASLVLPRATEPVSATPTSNTMHAGDQLQEGQFLRSTDGRYRAVLQTDGNFVVYDGAKAIWWNGVKDYFGLNHIVLGADGDLVARLNVNDAPLWSTQTKGSDADRLVMQTDGNLVMYNDRYQPIWSSKTGKLPPPPPPPSVLSIGESASVSISRDGGYSVPIAGQELWVFDDTSIYTNTPPVAPRGLDILNTNGVLQEGQQIVSKGGRFRAVLNNNGNFAVYDGTKAIWTNGIKDYYGKNHIVLQADGNLVSSLSNGTPLWSTNTSGQGTTFLLMQADGNLVLSAARYLPLWSSVTGRIWKNNSDRSWYQSGFVESSTAAIQATPSNAAPTSLNEVAPSPSVPSQFLASPTNLYMPDGTKRLCTPANGANYQARWPNGAVLMPNGVDVLVTFVDLCVTSALFRAEAWGFLEYNSSTHTLTQPPTQVFVPDPSGAETPKVWMGSPVIQGTNAIFFTPNCPDRFLSCPGVGSSVSVTTVADISTTANLLNPANYASTVNLAVPTGAQRWRPMIINVAKDTVHGGYLMLEQSSISGNYQLFRAANPTGQWTQVADAVMQGCRGLPKGFCYSMILHPEISSTSSTLYVSFFDPQAGPDPDQGHLVMATIPSP